MVSRRFFPTQHKIANPNPKAPPVVIIGLSALGWALDHLHPYPEEVNSDPSRKKNDGFESVYYVKSVATSFPGGIVVRGRARTTFESWLFSIGW